MKIHLLLFSFYCYRHLVLKTKLQKTLLLIITLLEYGWKFHLVKAVVNIHFQIMIVSFKLCNSIKPFINYI